MTDQAYAVLLLSMGTVGFVTGMGYAFYGAREETRWNKLYNQQYQARAGGVVESDKTKWQDDLDGLKKAKDTWIREAKFVDDKIKSLLANAFDAFEVMKSEIKRHTDIENDIPKLKELIVGSESKAPPETPNFLKEGFYQRWSVFTGELNSVAGADFNPEQAGLAARDKVGRLVRDLRDYKNKLHAAHKDDYPRQWFNWEPSVDRTLTKLEHAIKQIEIFTTYWPNMMTKRREYFDSQYRIPELEAKLSGSEVPDLRATEVVGKNAWNPGKWTKYAGLAGAAVSAVWTISHWETFQEGFELAGGGTLRELGRAYQRQRDLALQVLELERRLNQP